MNQVASQVPDPLLFPQAVAPWWQMLPPVPAATASFVVTRENVSPLACTKFHLLHPLTWGLPVTVLRVLENSQEGFISEALSQTSLFPSLRGKKTKAQKFPIWQLQHPQLTSSLVGGTYCCLLGRLQSYHHSYTETSVKICKNYNGKLY